MKLLLTSLLIILYINAFSQSSNFDQLIKTGIDYYNKGLTQQALANYEKAHSIDSTRVEAYYYTGIALANSCHQTGNLCTEAITMLSTALNINPKYRNSFYNRGVCFLRLNMFSQAIVDFDNAIKLDERDGDAYANRGVSKIKSGQKKNGCKDIQKAINLNSTEAQKLKNFYCP
jgi:tetratricopeptide (TPR) repeat protein